jgi:thiol peroxidase
MVVLSDHMGYEFGQAYGVLVKERNLLARSVFVVRKDGKIAHREIVQELTEHPDYEAALEAAKKALGK